MKLLALAVGLGGLSAVSEIATTIAAVAAALAGVGWIYRRILRPAAGAAAKTYRAVDALEDLPAFMRDTKGQLDQGSERFRQLEQRIALAERGATAVAVDTAETREHTAALVRELDVVTRGEGPSGA